jgi:hypothetical protein
MRPACADRGCQPEEKWYALTGRVVDAKVEADGDIHLALQDADGKNAGTVSAEIPVGPKWCEIRQMVFGWTKQTFPFTVKSVHDLTIAEHVVTVTGSSLSRLSLATRRLEFRAEQVTAAPSDSIRLQYQRSRSWFTKMSSRVHGRNLKTNFSTNIRKSKNRQTFSKC